MTAFARAVDVLFADPNLALDALWLSQGQGVGVPVRVMRQAPDAETAFGQTRVLTDAVVFTVRVAEVPTPQRGDVIEVGDEAFIVRGAPKRDPLRLFWTAEAEFQG